VLNVGQIWCLAGFFLALMLWMLQIDVAGRSIGVSFNKAMVCGALPLPGLVRHA
jgi:hypothetical protein